LEPCHPQEKRGDDLVCTCGLGKEFYKGSCVPACFAPRKRDETNDDRCVCPDPQREFDPATEKCVCKANYTEKDGVCVLIGSDCDPVKGQVWVPSLGKCQCPVGTVEEADGTCRLPEMGEKCVSNGVCGTCVKSCGNQSENLYDACTAYDLRADKDVCNLSAAGGGGKPCGTGVCCIVSARGGKPVSPGVDNACPQKIETTP
jgi:hypothetical protein